MQSEPITHYIIINIIQTESCIAVNTDVCYEITSSLVCWALWWLRSKTRSRARTASSWLIRPSSLRRSSSASSSCRSFSFISFCHCRNADGSLAPCDNRSNLNTKIHIHQNTDVSESAWMLWRTSQWLLWLTFKVSLPKNLSHDFLSHHKRTTNVVHTTQEPMLFAPIDVRAWSVFMHHI